MACALWALLGVGCSGQILLGSTAVDPHVDALAVCTPLNPVGLCSTGQVCAHGACYDARSAPPSCAVGVNGLCPVVGDACVSGVCTAIAVDAACSAARPSGLCPGGEACVRGVCFTDDGTLTCSAASPTGPCPSGQSCQQGACATFFGTCNASDFDGICATWEACAAGVCVGPVAPDACSAAHPDGRCPADEVCVAGTCTGLSVDNVCSPQRLQGLCGAGAACAEGGHCVAIAPSTACSATRPAGLCSGGGVCRAGSCVTPDCNSGGTGYACAAGTWCTGGACAPLPCGPTNPNGACDDPTLACVRGLCTAPTCSPTVPQGACPGDLVCQAGSCAAHPCDPAHPQGPCPDSQNYVCSSGTCVQRPCSAQAPGGSCTGTQARACTNDPVYGCIFALQAQCCDAPLTGRTGCLVGQCAPPPCAPTQPHGACPEGQICSAGACVQAPCSPFFPGGTCAAPLQCLQGQCTQTGCATSADPNAACAPLVCDLGRNVCKLPACSAAHTNGVCSTPGQTCCTAAMANSSDPNYNPNCGAAGACVTPLCSTQFPGGVCANGNQVCAAGHCTTPPCSATHPNGVCGTNFSCQGGSCTLLPCGAGAPQGSCPAGQSCVNGSPPACAPYVCSNPFPNGPCLGANAGYICVNTGTSGAPNYVCQQPPCSGTYPGGACADSNNLCSSGTCVPAPCGPTRPHGACPRSQACTAGGNGSYHCTLMPCATADPRDSGACPAGQVCCNNALKGSNFCSTLAQCVATTCSPQFPFGSCSDANQVCLGSSCQYVCGAAHPTGVCPSGLACVERGCASPCTNDQDCDTISDTDEGIASLTDTDGDGIPDAYDHDSDGDTIPDAVEAGDRLLSTPPVDTGNKGVANFRSLDSDSDHVADAIEAGPAPGVPRDTDTDGLPDYIDTDSDNDGILDRCEARDAGGTLCGNTTLLTSALALADSDGDGTADIRERDSDGDGIADAIEARSRPSDASTLNSQGVDHDGDGLPDYRDPDSDQDGVLDRDEDKNGDGIVNCQLDGSGNVVPDSRPQPTCGSTSAPFSASVPYDYNPACPAAKCLLAETNRIVADTDGNGIGDGQDGINFVCSAANLKPVNVFYSQAADYALALEQSFTTVHTLARSGTQVGMTFDDPNTLDGSYGVSGLVLGRTPTASAIAATGATAAQALINKALAQSQSDKVSLAAVSGVTSVGLVLNRNFTSFDGYGVALSRYNIATSASVSVGKLRDQIALQLGTSFDGFSALDAGPSTQAFTLQMETLYRYDNGSNQGAVLVIGALLPTGADYNAAGTYSYRTRCASQSGQSACQARAGCVYSGGACTESPAYQLPLFYADNISNGSAITQYGNDMASLCQSLLQRNGVLDVLWTVDNSGSMADKIGQVVNASALFFPFLNNSEADYRVGMTTTTSNSQWWQPVYPGCIGITGGSAQAYCENNGLVQGQTYAGGCTWNSSNSTCVPMCSLSTSAAACSAVPGCTWNVNAATCGWGGCGAVSDPNRCTKQFNCVWANGRCDLVGTPDLINGNIAADFTGAIAGQTNTGAADRSVSYACSQGCVINSCGGYTSQATCNTHLACTWNSTTSACVTNCCPACLNQSGLVPNDPACYFAARLPNDTGSGNEFGLLMTEWALYRAGAQTGCGAATSAATCTPIPGCIWDGALCVQGYCAIAYANGNSPASTQCNGWTGSTPPYPSFNPNSATNPGAAETPANCEWNPLTNSCYPTMGMRCNTYASQVACAAQSPRCQWLSGNCVPNEPANRVMCSAGSQAACVLQGNGQCQWDTCSYADAASCSAVYGCVFSNGACAPVAGGGACRPPLKRMMRANATKLAVLISDEEECFVKDGPSSSGGGGSAYDGNCAGGQYTGGLMSYSDVLRREREASYIGFMQGRGVLTYSLVGDKADATQAPATTTVAGNGGCRNTVLNYTAEAGQAYTDAAEGTGGGWGSICAQNLYPSIEAISIGGLSAASPYKLAGFIGGRAVQPISSTIKVAVQACAVASEYPGCASGTTVRVVARSRDNGFDYDALNNSLVFYGAARPAAGASITVSYRYWVDRYQPPQGSTACPCPQTTAPGCACPPGQACGIVGATNRCSAVATAAACPQTAGCIWNTANGGFCEADGLCAADPTCGGVACQSGYACDPTLGLCNCDVTCGGSCHPGSTCDNNANIHACAGLSAAACGQTAGCAYSATLAACMSSTCGQCVCDPTCGGGCPAGQRCDANTASATCGQCLCDTTCGGATCPVHEVCNTNTSSPTCGLCQPPGCGSCPAGFICSPSAGICVCDTTCGGGTPPAGQICDTAANSPTCGQLTCDTTCGGGCPSHQVCNGDPNSQSCGFCAPDPTCGVPNGQCNVTCAGGSSASSCAAISGCQWKRDAHNLMGCYPQACQACDAASGLCTVDTACTDCSCNDAEACDPSSGRCVCDITCRNSCGNAGQLCDHDRGSATCGHCICDTTCGGPCQSGQRCDTTASSSTCGTCIIDTTCGGGCAYPLVCNPSTGLCGPDSQCGGCPQGYVCDVSTGQCQPPGG